MIQLEKEMKILKIRKKLLQRVLITYYFFKEKPLNLYAIE